MPIALSLFVVCPLTDGLKPLSICQNCKHNFGIMEGIMLSCEICEDEEVRP
jgi:hypothetical protein